jgi:site-specific recombinase XerD
MANINFRPNKGKKVLDLTKPQQIYFRYRLGRKIDFNAPIIKEDGYKVLIDDWDFKKQRVKPRKKILNGSKINSKIKALDSYFTIFEEYNINNKITPTYETVKKHFDSFCKTPKQLAELKKTSEELATPQTFFKYVDAYIENAKTKPNAKTKKPVTSSTIKDYISTKNILKQFNDEVKKFDFADIDLDWYKDFNLWCNQKGYNNNYKGKQIKTLKTFLNNALEEGVTENRNHQKRDFVVLKEDSDSIYLNQDELNSIWQLDLSNHPTMEVTRNLFLIGCFTGLRVSDFNHLKPSSIRETEGVKMIVVKAQKTKKTVAIPMHPIIEAILLKYNGVPPKMFDQKINQNIKEIARLAGIDEPIETATTKGGFEVSKIQPKYELVMTHTARRSFCTNAYLSGMESIDIMAISGHKSEKNFLLYIKVTPEQRAIKMSKTNFFMNATALKIA